MDVSVGNYITRAWTDGCMDEDSSKERCVGNNAVYRVTFSAFLFFLLAAMASYCKPTANREAWPAKYVLFLFLIFGTCFIPNDPFLSAVYLNIARIGAAVFVIIQQVIVLDLSHNWNESWVEKSNACAESEQTQKRWLGAILVSCAFLFILTLTGIGLLFGFYGGCTTNDTFIAVTLVLSIALTLLQLTGEEGSLLSSAVIACYGTYLCFTAVAKNPDVTCNPNVGERDVLSVVLGVIVTLVGLAWTGYAYTVEKRVDGEEEEEETENKNNDNNEMDEEKKNEDRKVQGIVANDEVDEEQPTSKGQTTPTQKPHVSWRLNLILAMVSCWIAMVLTGWGSIEAGGSLSNPDVSEVSMWILIGSQWLMFVLYAWTLLAPRIFANREFS